MASDFLWGDWSERDGLRIVEVTVPADLIYLEGHFVGRPMVPGVAQLVGLAQRGASQCWPDLPSPKAVSRLKFKAELGPGDRIELRFRRNQDKVSFQFFKGETECSQGVLEYEPAS
ncbi:MAG: hypothetical protein AAGF12_36555 [Myxococcota bacterium]